MNALRLARSGGMLAALALSATPASGWAQSAQAKAVVDQAKAAGSVGEQADGFLGLVGAADTRVQGAVAEINAGRAQVYQATAAKTGVTPATAGEATARIQFARVPPGQFVKPQGEGWRRK